jgi:hypothetical protein
VKRNALFAGLCLAIIGVSALVVSAFVPDAARQAVWASASLAFAVQMVAFTVVQLLPERQVMVGWGLGALFRLMAVVLWGVFLAKVWRAPLAAALLSFVAFLFVTTVLEPAFLKR